MTQSRFLIQLAMVLTWIVTVTSISFAQSHQQHSLTGMHGMVLLSDSNEQWLASHLPLYAAPHNYQIIYRVTPNDEAFARKVSELSFVTILPEQFDLQRLIKGQKLTLDTAFYDGHFERGGKLIGKAMLTFSEPVYLKKLDTTRLPANGTFDLVPLNTSHRLAVHHIGQPPSFDAVVLVANNPEQAATQTCDIASPFVASDIAALIEKCLDAKILYLETTDFQ